MNIKNSFKRLYKSSKGPIEELGLENNFVVKTALRFLRSRLKSNFVNTTEGHKMFLDPLDSLALSINKVYEEFETEMVKKIIKEGDAVVDIGANIGYYTLIFAKLVKNKGRVIAFEPEPNNFKLLEKNLEINGYKNVDINQKAVSSNTGRTTLYLDETNLGGHTMGKKIPNQKSIEIDSIKLDDYFKNYDRKIDFIKMDVEGAEMEAIKGMFTILQNSHDIKILSEFDVNHLKKFNVKPEDFLQILEDFGFNIYSLQKKKVKPFGVKKFLEKCKSKNNFSTNLLCIKGDQNFSIIHKQLN